MDVDEGDGLVDDAKVVGPLCPLNSLRVTVTIEDEITESVSVAVGVVGVVTVVALDVFVGDSIRVEGELSSAVSGQFGNAQGSVEQHPRKLFRAHRKNCFPGGQSVSPLRSLVSKSGCISYAA